MGIFDPKVEANIPVVQPQVQQSALGGLASWISDGIVAANKTAAAGGPTAGQQKDALELAQGQGLQDSLLKAEALRREGRVDEANRAEQRVLANAARDGMDLSSGSTKALYRATTGRDPEFMGMSMEERMAEEAMKAPEFQGAYIATYASGKDMTDQERINASFGQMARIKSNEQMLTNNSIDWDQGRSQAFTGAVTDFTATTLGQLQIAASQGTIVGIDTINQAQVGWQARKAQLLASKPAGLSDAQWKPIQDQMAQTDRAFETLLQISQVEGNRGLSAQVMQPIAAALMADKNLTAMEKHAGINALPKLVELGVVSYTDVKKTLESLKVADISTSVFSEASAGGIVVDEVTGEASLFPKEIMEGVSKIDPVEALNQAKSITTVTGATSPEALIQDAGARDEFMLLTSKAFAAMTTISKDRNQFASTKTVNQVFDGKVVASIDAVAKSDPAKARTLFLQGEEALNQQHAIATTALRNTIRPNSVLSFDEETKTLNMDMNSFKKLGMNDDNLLLLRNAADSFYGGDQLAMIKDKGSRMQASAEYRTARQLLKMGIWDGVRSEAAELTALAGNVRALDAKRKIFSDKADSLDADPTTQKSGDLIRLQNMRDREEEFLTISGFDEVKDDVGFLNAVGGAADRLGIDPKDLLQSISFETVGTFSTSIKNPNGSATGLIQFIESTAKGLGTSTAMLKNMTRTEQMAYVEKYLAPYKGKMKNLGDVYMAIHWPAGIGKGNDYVMYKDGSDEYAANKNLDVNGDGTVTRAETLARLNGSAGVPTEAGATLDLTGGSPSADTTAPAQPSAPDGMGLVDAVQLATLGANASRAGRALAADTAADAVRSNEGAPAQPETPTEDKLSKSVAREQDNAAMAKLVDEKLSPKQKRQLKALGVRPEEVDFFETQKEAEAALAAGEVEAGTIYVDGLGNVWKL